MDKIKHLRIYVRVYQERNFSKAAAKLGLSPSTVSKSISTLEDAIGVRLVERSTRSLAFTQAGIEYAQMATEVMQKLEDVEGSLRYSSRTASGTMKIHLPVSYGRLYILPILPLFKEMYPDIRLDIVFSDEHIDIIRDGYDLSVLAGQIKDCGLIAKKMSPIDFLICASPEYLEQNRESLSGGQWQGHTWIRFRCKHNGKLAPVYVPKKGGQHPGSVHEELTIENELIVNDGEAMLELCSKGAGLAQVPHFVARKWLEEGKVVAISSIYRPPDTGVYVIYPGRRNLPERCRHFIDFLKNSLAAIGEHPEHTWALEALTVPADTVGRPHAQSTVWRSRRMPMQQ